MSWVGASSPGGDSGIALPSPQSTCPCGPGGSSGPNYDPDSIAAVRAQLDEAGRHEPLPLQALEESPEQGEVASRPVRGLELEHGLFV